MSNYTKVAGYKDNIQKPITFLCSSNEQVEFEIKNTIPFTLVPSKLITQVINLIKYLYICMRKPTNSDEQLENKINEEIFCAHGKEDSILSRYLFFQI